MVLPRAQEIQRREVKIPMIPGFTMEPQTRDIDADVVGPDVSDVASLDTIRRDAVDAGETVECPHCEGSIEPVFVGSGLTEA